MIFQVTFDRFMEEVRKEKIFEDGRNKIECEIMNGSVAYYLVPLELKKVFVTVLTDEEVEENPTMLFGLKGLVELSKRVVDNDELLSMKASLEKIEERLGGEKLNG